MVAKENISINVTDNVIIIERTVLFVNGNGSLKAAKTKLNRIS